jgi:hypothetical protein
MGLLGESNEEVHIRIQYATFWKVSAWALRIRHSLQHFSILQLNLLVGVNRNNSQRGANLSKLPLDGQPVLVAFVVIIILPILSMLKDAGHFRARHFGKRARYRFGRVSLDRVLSLFRSHLVLFVESQV